MRKSIWLVLSAMFSLVFFSGIVLAADDNSAQAQVPAAEPELVAPVPEPAHPGELDLQWLWGEVKSVDAANKEITVNYLDYESDGEKEVKILTDEKTNFENIKALADIKVKDTVSVDYVLTPDNKYLARLVSIEKPEEMLKEPPADVPAATGAPAAPATE